MARRLIVGVALASVAALSAAGCSSSSSHKTKDTAAADVLWARHVCESIGSNTSLQLPTVDPKDSAKTRQSIVTFLNGLSTQLKGVQVRLSAVGNPPVSNGKQTLATALTDLSQTQAAVSKAAAELSKAKVTDEKSLQVALNQAGKVIGNFQAYQGPAKDLRANPALNDAFNQAVACQTRKL